MVIEKETQQEMLERYQDYLDEAAETGRKIALARMKPHILYGAKVRNAGSAGWCCELKCPDALGVTAYGKSPEAACIEFDRIWQGLPKSTTDSDTVKMIKNDDGHYIPEECCSFTNPATTPSGNSEIDDYDLPCGSDCEGNCSRCIIQKIFNHYAMLTGQYDPN